MDKNYQVINLKEKVAADYQIKAAFLGNSGVGKTSIIKYEIENQVPIGVQPTSIFQYFSKDCLICDKIIHLQIWDMGGDSTYEKLLTNFYSASLCIFVVFALDDKDSFEDLDKWLNNIRNDYQSGLPFLIIIGNKKDNISNRQVTEEEIEDFKIKNNIDYYYETSAKSGESIHELFEDILKKIYIKFIEPNISDAYSTKSSVSTTQSYLNPCVSESDKCKVCDCIIF